MKKIKIVSIILLFLIILPIIFTSCQSDNSDVKGAFELSDEEWNALKDAGASEKQKIVKFENYNPDLTSGQPFGESISDFEKSLIETPYYLDIDKQKVYYISEGVASDEVSPPFAKYCMDVYECISNLELLFSFTKATKNLVSDLEIYRVDIYHHVQLGAFVILETNCGEFVYLRQVFWHSNADGIDINEYKGYLMPVEKYAEVAKLLNDIQYNFNFTQIMTRFPDAGELLDLSEYEVKRYENVTLIAVISVAVVCVGGVCGYVVYKKRKTKSVSDENNE